MIVTQEDIRKKIIGACEEVRVGFPGLFVVYPNQQQPDYNTQVDPFVQVDIALSGGDSINMNSRAHRVYGNIVIDAYAKAGTGVSKINALLDAFYRKFQNEDALFPARTLASSFTPLGEWKDWQRASAVIPLWYDSD